MKTLTPTKIICTLGPASNTEEIIKKMIEKGMSIARINFSHGTKQEKKTMFALLNSIRSADEYSSLAIALDTKGLEIRTGVFEESTLINKGDTVVLTTDAKYKNKCTKERIFVNHSGIYGDLNKKTKDIYVDDGKIQLEIVSVSEKDQEIVTKAKTSGKVSSRKGVNIPNAHISLPSLSIKDKEDILFGVKNGADFIFASFVRKKEDIQEIREIVKNTEIKIVAKIENQHGIDNIVEIIEESDGIMIARGDMGIEIDYAKLFAMQCLIFKECRARNKPCIVATQILESMKDEPIPTRAEVIDLSFAVLLGAGCTMLSGETASGKYPVKSVDVMQKIIVEASKSAVSPFSQVYSGLVNIQSSGFIDVFISHSRARVRGMQIVFGCHPVLSTAYKKDSMQPAEGYALAEVHDSKQ